MAFGFKSEKNLSEAIKDLAKLALEKKVVEGTLLMAPTPTGKSFSYILTTELEAVDASEPIAPVMPVQGARVLSKITRKGKLSRSVLAVLRPCEVRAAIELSKINQLDLESFVLLSFECLGVYSLRSFLDDPSTASERFLCSVCVDFTGEEADVSARHIGLNGVVFVANTEKGRGFLEALGLLSEVDDTSSQKLEEKKRERAETRKQFLSDFSSQVSSPEALLDVLSSCINCHNCRSVCPICFCRECFFDSPALKVPPHLYVERARRKGGLRFIPDTLLFHLGRMNHMSLSCVSCGMCEDACPNFIPVGRLFTLVSERTRAIFNYKPGRDPKEPIPFMDFKEEELKEFEVPYVETRK